ncbi:MAG: methyltransferase domain-containing protein [bacterium]
MPIQIDREGARQLAPRFDEAMDMVANEFAGLDPHCQYRNAFARLLKWDPLGRVLMLGTDQRDGFIPELRRAIADFVPSPGAVFDFGCGDGQTLALAIDALPKGTRISCEDPNPDYVARYRHLIESRRDLEIGASLVAGFDELDAVAQREDIALPADGTIHLGLALQMLFFVADLERSVLRMARFLAPGGALFIVLADESEGFTGHALRAFIEAGGDTGANAAHLAAIAQRRACFGGSGDGGGTIVDCLRQGLVDRAHRVTAARQPTRLFGHTLADIIAMSAITVLGNLPGTDKFAAVRRLIEERPEHVDLRIEDDGPRAGMLSVTQPQWVVCIERRSAADSRP